MINITRVPYVKIFQERGSRVLSSNIAVEVKKTLQDCIGEMDSCRFLFAKNPLKDFTRDRKLGFATLIAFLIGIKGGTLDDELEDYFTDENELMTSSAFVQQRAKLTDFTFKYLLSEFNKRCSSFDAKRYKGYRIIAVDGSDFNIAYDEKSHTFIDNPRGEGYNQLHLNAVYDVLNNIFVNIDIQATPEQDERKACLNILKKTTFTEPTLLIADRGYEAYYLFEEMNRIPNLEYMFRVRHDCSKLIRNLPMEEFDKYVSIEIRTTQTKADKEAYRTGKAVFVPGPSKFGKDKKTVSWMFESPFILRLRVVRFKISPDTYETIVTSLNSVEFPIKEIKKLYHKRWMIETGFRWLKYAVCGVNFHGKSEEFSRQEIYVHIIMYNFGMRILMNVEIKQKASWKYYYQINFTKGFKYCFGYWRYRGSSPPNLIRQTQRHILPVREGRTDQRKLKPKCFIPYVYRVAA